MPKYYNSTFASSGDKQSVPDAVPVDGSVSYDAGYNPRQELPYTDPQSTNIIREQDNQIIADITENIQQYQQVGSAEFITSAINGGTPFPYEKSAQCRFGGETYISLEDANTDQDPSASINWVPIASRTLSNSLPFGIPSLSNTVFEPLSGTEFTLQPGVTYIYTVAVRINAGTAGFEYQVFLDQNTNTTNFFASINYRDGSDVILTSRSEFFETDDVLVALVQGAAGGNQSADLNMTMRIRIGNGGTPAVISLQSKVVSSTYTYYGSSATLEIMKEV